MDIAPLTCRDDHRPSTWIEIHKTSRDPKVNRSSINDLIGNIWLHWVDGDPQGRDP